VTGPRVLFVSKPIVPPWNDGSKNLVRDVARHLTRASATVLTTEGAPSLGDRVAMEAIYTTPGRFAPGLAQNAIGQSGALPVVHREAALKVRQAKCRFPVAAIKGSQQGEQRGVLRDRHKLAIAKGETARRKIARED